MIQLVLFFIFNTLGSVFFFFFFLFFEKQVHCSLVNFKHIIALNSIVIENNNGIFNVYLIG